MMRKLGLIGSLGLLALFATIIACAVEPTAEPNKTASDDATATTVGAPAPAEEATAAAPGDVAPNAVNCARVDFCDAPGSTGTTCTLLNGCSLNAAVSDCLGDLGALQCKLRCSAVMQTPSGDKTFRLHCGGAAGSCCPAGTKYCGLNGACCDGIEFGHDCPPL